MLEPRLWRVELLNGLGQDLRLAGRTLRRRPGFAAAAIATLALGIGASTAIFSVAYGVSLRPLPYPDPDRLIRIYEASPANGQLEQDVSVGAFHDWREGAHAIESAALFSKAYTRFLAGSDQPPVTTMSVSPAFFDVLGAKPMIGPGFKSEKAYTRFTADEEAMLSYAAWQRLFGGRSDTIGKLLEFSGAGDNDVYRIVGVMPESFVFDQPVDLWRPTKIVEVPVSRMLRNSRYDRVVARLRRGTTIEQARAELEVVAARLAREFPTSNGGWTVTVKSLHESLIGNFGRATWLLLAAVAVVLLVTCVNVGGLLLARAVARERETAVRAALGAGTWRLLRLWLAEATLLTACGAGLAVCLAWAGVSALKAAAPPGIPRLEAVALDVPALAVAALAAVFSVVMFTMAPFGRARPRDLERRLRAGSPGGGDGRRSMRYALTAAQCAGAATLVVLAVMLTRSVIKLTSVDLGWDPAGVLSMSVTPPMPRELRRPWYRYVEWSDRLIARLEATKGIERAAITTQVPLALQPYPSTLAKGRGKTANDDARWPAVQQNVTDGYFELMGVRLIAGRTFGPGDRFAVSQVNGTERAERGVAVVSERTARTLWPDRAAVGQTLWVPDNDNVAWREVVGVVEDIQFYAVGETPALHIFIPWTQHSTGRPRLLVKGRGASLATGVREIVESVEPGTHIDQVAPLDALVARATAQPRFTTRVVSAFGALALILSAVGIYGTLSYLVGARRREIGIRLALGAPRAAVMSDVLVRGLVPAAAGGAIGLAIAAALARTFRALLFEVEPLDAGSFAGGAAVLLVVAVAAAGGPARRASRVDPAAALRSE